MEAEAGNHCLCPTPPLEAKVPFESLTGVYARRSLQQTRAWSLLDLTLIEPGEPTSLERAFEYPDRGGTRPRVLSMAATAMGRDDNLGLHPSTCITINLVRKNAMATSVAVLVGSLRKASFSRKMAHVLIGLAPVDLKFEIVEVGDLPLYNEDLEQETPPAAWTAFRDKVKGSDAVLFVTPEYNRSVPAVLKNALDVGSRPYGKSVWSGKPGAVVSVSPGGIGGFGANHHLRQSLVFLDVPTLQQPETYIGGVGNLFDESGKLMNGNTEKFLMAFMATFGKWIASNRSRA